jgi:hypothetical protein
MPYCRKLQKQRQRVHETYCGLRKAHSQLAIPMSLEALSFSSESPKTAQVSPNRGIRDLATCVSFLWLPLLIHPPE